MGYFLDGVWHDQWHDTAKTKGRFERQPTRFHNWVTADGSPGPAGEGGFPAEAGRYHLYVSLACPWAHRTIIFRKLKKLNDAISLSIVSPLMGSQAGPSTRRKARPAIRSTTPRSSPTSTSSTIRNIPAASPCRCCGTRSS